MNGKMSQGLPSATAFPGMFCIPAVISLATEGSRVWVERELFGAAEGSSAGAPTARQLPVSVAQGMSRSTEDCCKMQGSCSSSARAPATGHPLLGASPAWGAWGHHDAPGVPKAKLWVLLGDELLWGS